MQLITGAETILGDLPAASSELIDVPLEAGSSLETGVQRVSSVDLIRHRLADRLEGRTEPVITIGGDCGVELGAVEHAAGVFDDVALVWFDAHADLGRVETSTSGAFHGMVVRSLLGDGPELLASSHPIEPSRLVLAGARAFDEAEAHDIADAGITHIPVGDFTADAVVKAVTAAGAQSVYLHVDLDVLDPDTIIGVTHPEPFGIAPAVLVEAITALKAEFAFAGGGITGFAPSSAEAATDDMGTILRIVGALAR
ncbi:hypothetical protein GCM10027416_05000 [Okibacterium endophyticum]